MLSSPRRALIGVSAAAALGIVGCSPQGTTQDRSHNPTAPSSPAITVEPLQRSTPSLSESEVELTGENSVELLPNPEGLSNSESAAIGATPPLTASPTWSFSFRRIGNLYKVTGWLRVAFNRSPGLSVNTVIRGELTHSLIGATYRIRSASEKVFIFTVPGFSSACPVPANRQDAFRVVDLTRRRVVIRVPVTWSAGSSCT